MTQQGLQPERTGLAWQRTALSAGAVAVLLLHSASREGWGVLTVPAAVAAACALVLAVAGGLRERYLRHADEPEGAAPLLCGAVAVLTAATAASALVTMLL